VIRTWAIVSGKRLELTTAFSKKWGQLAKVDFGKQRSTGFKHLQYQRNPIAFYPLLPVAMDILECLKADYRKFPRDQTYSIYAKTVYFRDPLNEFRGCDRYQKMIRFIETWFIDPQLDLHQIQRDGNAIRTDWTLKWTTPLPWKPRIAIDGWSELLLNEQELIISHIDYWHCSRLEVLKQHFWGDRPRQ
jgi:hypothetical protein